MSEVESLDSDDRKRRAEARLVASRPAREAAAAAHARDMARADGCGGDSNDKAAALADPDNPPWTDEELAKARRERDERLAAEKRRA